MIRHVRRTRPARRTAGPGGSARLLPVLSLTGGLVLLVLAALLAPPGQPTSTGGERARQLAETPTVGAGAGAAGAPTTRGVAAGGAPAAPQHPARPADAGAAGTPVALQIEAIEVSAAVAPVGVDTGTGLMEVPERIDRLGWYRYGPGLDDPAGSTVIAGHVDGEAGRGVFFRLGELEPGDTVTATGADGHARTYQVVAREVHPKSDIPLDRYFAHDGAPRLTLITCGGAFDPGNRRYQDNIVITAVPA